MKDCVKCGYCCTVRPCGYGEWDDTKKQCKFLSEPNDIGQRFCKKYSEIVKKEKDSEYSMMGCGCSSTLFNDMRNTVIINRRIKVITGKP